MSFSIFQQPDHVQITQNENFSKVSIHDIYVALNEESRQVKDSNVDSDKTNTEWIQLCSPLLLHLYKVSGMLTPQKCEETTEFLHFFFGFVLRSLKAFLKTNKSKKKKKKEKAK